MRIALAFSAVLALLISLVPTVSDAAELVGFQNRSFRPGTIVIKNSQKRLYLILGGGRAIRYKVAVGKRGKVWTGQTFIDGKYVKPAWSPSEEVHRDHPSLPDVIAGGAPNNPMGVAALTLNGGKYAIHGTNRPGSIGRAVSYGCIRMANSDITDLFRRVGLRTPVIAVP